MFFLPTLGSENAKKTDMRTAGTARRGEADASRVALSAERRKPDEHK